MSNYALEPPECDFIIVRKIGGITRMEEWRLKGRLENAMHAVVDDLFDGKVEDYEKAEFYLGFIAAIDILANGNLKLDRARDRSQLASTIEKAWRSMHGKVEPDPITTVFTDACEKMNERRVKGGAR